MIAYHSNVSNLSRQDMIQIISVLEVSIVERCAAEAYLVVMIPQTLKIAIEAAIMKASPIITPFSDICLKA